MPEAYLPYFGRLHGFANGGYYLDYWPDAYIKTYKGKADYALKASIPKKKNRVKLSWKANPIASGYQIQFSTKKNGKYKTVKTVSSKVKKVTLKAKKNGYYRIRAKYVYNGKTKWFGYSNVVKAKPRKK